MSRHRSRLRTLQSAPGGDSDAMTRLTSELGVLTADIVETLRRASIFRQCADVDFAGAVNGAFGRS